MQQNHLEVSVCSVSTMISDNCGVALSTSEWSLRRHETHLRPVSDQCWHVVSGQDSGQWRDNTDLILSKPFIIQQESRSQAHQVDKNICDQQTASLINRKVFPKKPLITKDQQI